VCAHHFQVVTGFLQEIIVGQLVVLFSTARNSECSLSWSVLAEGSLVKADNVRLFVYDTFTISLFEVRQRHGIRAVNPARRGVHEKTG